MPLVCRLYNRHFLRTCNEKRKREYYLTTFASSRKFKPTENTCGKFAENVFIVKHNLYEENHKVLKFITTFLIVYITTLNFKLRHLKLF